MIEFHSVTFSYHPDRPVLRNLSVSFGERERVLMIGQNGAGKSTFLKLLNGLLTPTAGAVVVNGQDTRTTSAWRIARSVSVTFQNPADQLFAATVEEELAFGPRNLHRPQPSELIRFAAQLFQLQKVLDSHPYDLPAASRKLLTVASAVASDCPVLALDEPSAGLSHPEREILRSAVLQLSHKSFLIVSHDLELFLPLCTRILVLARGTIQFDGHPAAFVDSAPRFRSMGIRLPLALRLRRLLGDRTATETKR